MNIKGLQGDGVIKDGDLSVGDNAGDTGIHVSPGEAISPDGRSVEVEKKNGKEVKPKRGRKKK